MEELLGNSVAAHNEVIDDRPINIVIIKDVADFFRCLVKDMLSLEKKIINDLLSKIK